MRSQRLFLLLLLLPPAWAAAAGWEPDDPNQHAASSPCEPGHYLTTDCYMGQAMGCCPCPHGSFLSHPNRELSCSLCTPCRKDQEMVSDCTPTRDRQCRCKPGEFYCDSEPCPDSCHRCTSCPGATLQSCIATRDTVCAPAAPAEPGPTAYPFVVSALVVFVVAFVIVIVIVVFGAIAWWRRRGVPLPQWLCRFTKPASAEPGGHSHGPRAGTGSCGSRAGSPRRRWGSSSFSTSGNPEAEGARRPAAVSLQVPESSGPFVSSPETRGADAPVPGMGARRLPEDDLDMASEPLILPGAPESPAGVDGPRPEEEAVTRPGPMLVTTA